MGAVAKLRAAVGIPALTPLEAAQAKFEQAMGESRKAREKLGDIDADLGKLQKAFEVEPTDDIADQIVALRAKRDRAQLYVDRASGLVKAAADAVEAARSAEEDAHLAGLDKAADTEMLTQRLEADWRKRAMPAIAELIAVIDDAQSAIEVAQGAAREAYKLRGKAPELEFATVSQYTHLRSLSWLARSQSFDVRHRLVTLFE